MQVPLLATNNQWLWPSGVIVVYYGVTVVSDLKVENTSSKTAQSGLRLGSLKLEDHQPTSACPGETSQFGAAWILNFNSAILLY